MTAASLPSYAAFVAVVVIVANLGTAWLVVLTMGENNGNVYSEGPPWTAALSCISLGLCHYNVVLPAEMSFWGSVGLCALGLWGAWVDYIHFSDRKKALAKSRQDRKTAS